MSPDFSCSMKAEDTTILPLPIKFISTLCCSLHHGPGDRDGKITKFTERSLSARPKIQRIRYTHEIRDSFGYHKSSFLLQ